MDPLYGPISIDDFSYRLVFSPEFQRLRYVRLCNIHSLYLTGASEPKRFEHCLGVYHLADLWCRSRALTGRQADVLRAAALLHDIQTGPFGHSFQYVMEDNPFTKRFEHADVAHGVRHRFLQIAGAAATFAGRPFAVHELLNGLAGEVFAAIEGKGTFGPLVSGTLDLDNLDNVVRLAFHMGLCDDQDRLLPARLTPLLEPVDEMLGAAPHARPYLERWFVIRRRLYEFLLLDRGEFAAKAMLTLAVELATAGDLLSPEDWRLTDEALLDHLAANGVGEHQLVGQIVRRLRVGDLFETVQVWRTSSTENYETLSAGAAKRELEQALERELAEANGPKVNLCVHYILDSKKTCRSLPFRNLETGENEVVGHDSRSLLIGVFVTNARSTGLTGAARAKASDIIQARLALSGLHNLELAEEPLSFPSARLELFA